MMMMKIMKMMKMMKMKMMNDECFLNGDIHEVDFLF